MFGHTTKVDLMASESTQSESNLPTIDCRVWSKRKQASDSEAHIFPKPPLDWAVRRCMWMSRLCYHALLSIALLAGLLFLVAACLSDSGERFVLLNYVLTVVRLIFFGRLLLHN